MTPPQILLALAAGGVALATLATPARPAASGPARSTRITSRYGMRFHPILKEWRMHHGIDLSLPQGTPLFPVGPGRVIRVRRDTKVGGTSVTVQHGVDWRTSYSHLSAVQVAEGQPVARATQLGRSGGQPGTWGAGLSTGPHLHLQAWRRYPDGAWRLVDPEPLIQWS